MPHRMKDGLIDYLNIMQMAGVHELGAPVPGSFAQDSVPLSTEQVEPIVLKETPAVLAEQSVEAVTPALMEITKGKSAQLKAVAEKVSQCTLCSELALNRMRTVFGSGDPNARLVFLAEAPDEEDDRLGLPFQDRTGKLLDDIITKGMKLQREEVYLCNLICCRPPGGRAIDSMEAKNCRPFLDQILEIVSPEFICCLGNAAAHHLLQINEPMAQMRGKWYHYKGAKVVCTYKLSYLLQNPAAKRQTWEDIQMLMREMGLMK